MKKNWLLAIEAAVVVIFLGLGYYSLAPEFHRQTEYQLKDGQISYKGQMAENRFNGKGTLVFDNQDRYEGMFVDGYFDGKGTFTSHDGWQYVGEFKKGIAEGQGILTTEKGEIFEGTFKNGGLQK